ncbi:hypothetical protein Ancab_023081, partial [Ancistrocladus abbreviatus]
RKDEHLKRGESLKISRRSRGCQWFEIGSPVISPGRSLPPPSHLNINDRMNR